MTICKYKQNYNLVVVFITKSVIMEKYCTYFCLALGTVFLGMSIFIAWKYLFTMGICYATAFMTTETREH